MRRAFGRAGPDTVPPTLHVALVNPCMSLQPISNGPNQYLFHTCYPTPFLSCFSCVALAALPPARRWALRTHRHWPAPFKAAARQLLLAAARRQQEASDAPPGNGTPAGATLAGLPPHLLHRIIQLASDPLSWWLSHSEH